MRLQTPEIEEAQRIIMIKQMLLKHLHILEVMERIGREDFEERFCAA